MSERETHPPRRITPVGGCAVPPDDPLRFPLDESELDTFVRAALTEDGAFDDITTIATVPTDRHEHGTIVARHAGVVAGVPLAIAAFRLLDPHATIRIDADDGVRVSAGMPILRVSAHARAILSAERVALNFLQRLSGIATLTGRYVDAVRGTRARILDTRKTTPGLRALEKYAVRAGGGRNHRFGLSDAVLIKDNHIAAVDGDVRLAIERAREFVEPGTVIEVECDSAEQVRLALDADADIILLDNMRPPQLAECVAIVHGRAWTEASGGITLETVRAVAETGVDRISVGALTHSAIALDIGLDFQASG
ncbi:MAG TPA: carboxylating nicotinate-nucleotide diphosphorylase [Gemmatimonadaceae bacterium]